MKRVSAVIRLLTRHTWWWTAAAIVLLAIAVTAARLLLPQLEQYRQQLEMAASAATGHPVAIGALKVEWHGLGPRLALRDVRLQDRGGSQALLSVDDAFIDISLPLSIYHRQIEFDDLILSGVVLNVVRRSDGRYELEGVQLEQRELSGDGSAALEWLLRQPRLALRDGVVRWRDERSGARLELSGVNVRLYNEGERHRLGGDVVLPETMGGALTLRIDAQGSGGRPEDLEVDFYFKGAQLQLAQWLADRPALGMHLVNGAIDLELWGMWRKRQLQQLRGELGVRELWLAREHEPESASGVEVESVASAASGSAAGFNAQLLPEVAGRFVWQGEGAAWQLEAEQLRLGSDAPPARLHLASRERDGARSLEAATTFVRLQTLAALAAGSAQLPPELQQRLEQLQPRGDLHDLYLKLELKEGAPPEYFARGRAGELGIAPWQHWPGVAGADLAFNLDHNGGVADLMTAGASFDGNGLFREPLPLDEVAGRLAWQRQGEGWAVDLRQLALRNSDLEAQLHGHLDILGDGASPRIDLRAEIMRANGAMTSRYLPVAVMHKETVAWLDRGIIAGDVTRGAMVLRGPLRQFPFVDGSGQFEIGFTVDNGILDYAPGWPRVDRLQADVTFAGNSMVIHGRRGRILATEIRDVTVAIDNFKAPVSHLVLTGETRGATADLLRFLDQSPLRQRFGFLTTGSSATGRSRLGLDLDIPLAHAGQIATRGWVSFENSTLDIKRLGVDLAAIHGELEFSDHGLEGRQLRAEVMGQPARLTVTTSEQPKNRGAILFEASGESRLAALARRLDLPFLSYLKGESRWQGRLELPPDHAAPNLLITSPLEGTAVELPEGVGKPAAVARPFELSAELGEKSALWRFSYGRGQLSGIFEQIHEAGMTRLNRAELALGRAARLPQGPGFRVAGSLERFDYGAWQPLLAAASGQRSGAGGSAKGGTVAVTEVDLAVASARIFDQPLQQVKLQAQRSGKMWSARIESREAAGTLTLPDERSEPLVMELERLHLAAGEGAQKGGAAPAAMAEEERIDPRELPPLHVRSADTRYGKAELGRMELVTIRRPGGMSIETLRFDGAAAKIDLQGSWVRGGDGRSRSQVSGGLDIRDLGTLLAGFGYVESVKKGDGKANVDLHWAGPLISPQLARLEGQVRFELKDGRLLEIEPGAGRLFGLLSVQALPRRLMLDFSDLFGKGLAFDALAGRFDFKDGNAVTRDFVLDGPGARVELQGRVGLAARDYDQQLTVTPHVTSGLPLAGVVVGGVGVGAAVLLAERLLKPQIDRATTIRYHVTGPWNGPVMERQ